MEWPIILAVIIAALIILLPVGFISYLNIAGLYSGTEEARRRRAAARRLVREAVQIIRNKQTLDQSILEVKEAAEEKQAGLEETDDWAMPTPMPGANEAHLVIVGGSAAGIQAAITARRLNAAGKITVIRREQKVVVPCGIPYIFGTLGSVEKNLIPDAAIGDAELVIDEVSSIDREAQTITMAGGRTIDYDKLILATGSQPLVPQLPGKELDNVFTIAKDVASLKRLQQALNKAKDVVVVGGGFIGLELADEYRKLGLNVTVVELLPNCLWLNCDEEFCLTVEKALLKTNVKLACGNGVKSIIGDGRVREVELSSGERLNADLVVLAIGTVSETKLAQQAGLEIGVTKGIKVDPYMRTNDPNIFAIGDCAEKYSLVTGQPAALRLASVATYEARIAVANLFKPCLENKGTVGVFCTKVANVALGVAGLTERAAVEAGINVFIGKASAVDRHPSSMPDAHDLQVKLIFDRQNGRLVGAEACGGGAAIGELTNALAILVQNGATPKDILTSQIGTHPALSASPIAYQTINAAERALVIYNYCKLVSARPMVEEEIAGIKH